MDFWIPIFPGFRPIDFNFDYFVLFFAESIYRRGARRWRKVYKVNGHIFQAKRFNRVTPFPLLAATLTCSQ